MPLYSWFASRVGRTRLLLGVTVFFLACIELFAALVAADTPYVGVLHYTEHVVQCADLRGTACHVVATLPVTEVFRLRDGRWVY